MTNPNESIQVVEALAQVTETSIKNDHALLDLCKIIADTVHLLEIRLRHLEVSIEETHDEMRALKNFITMISHTKEDIQ